MLAPTILLLNFVCSVGLAFILGAALLTNFPSIPPWLTIGVSAILPAAAAGVLLYAAGRSGPSLRWTLWLAMPAAIVCLVAYAWLTFQP